MAAKKKVASAKAKPKVKKKVVAKKKAVAKSVRCASKTKDGKRCKRLIKGANRKNCSVHTRARKAA